MTDLLDKLQHATEGSRQLDGYVAYAIKPDKALMKEVGGQGVSYANCVGAPHYTTNLQDAVSLVPEGYQYAVGSRNLPSGQFFAEVIRPPQSAFSNQGLGKAPTVCLALCIAIIKAHESKTPKLTDAQKRVIDDLV